MDIQLIFSFPTSPEVVERCGWVGIFVVYIYIFIYSGDDTWEPLMGKVATGYMCDLSDQMPF